MDNLYPVTLINAVFDQQISFMLICIKTHWLLPPRVEPTVECESPSVQVTPPGLSLSIQYQHCIVKCNVKQINFKYFLCYVK